MFYKLENCSEFFIYNTRAAKMAKSIFILLTTGIILIAAHSVSQDTPLTAELHHVTRYVQEIMRRHFAPRTPVLVSAPNTQQHNITGRPLTPKLRSINELPLADLILYNFNIYARWPILFVTPADSSLGETTTLL
jgi:hypothetical protein